MGDFAMSAKKHLAEIAEDGSFTGRDAILRGGTKDGGENAANVFGTLEGAGGLFEF